MNRRQLLITEGAIVIAGLVLLYAIFGWPFGGGDGGGGGDEAVAAVTGEETVGGGDDAGDDDEPDEGDEATPTPAAPSGCRASVDPAFLSANQVLSYYGNPYAETLGILGQHELPELLSLLQAQADVYDALNGVRGVQPALHMVYETAQPHPTDNGLYILFVDDDTTQEYADFACEQGLLMFLDLQVGRSSVEAEVSRILPYLHQSHIQVAIDPEFTMHGDEVPGEHIGHLDADEINTVQRIIDEYVTANNLPDRILVIHQFDESMIVGKERIERFDHVSLVIDMDGFGPKETKIRKFGIYAQPAEHAGIKVFFQQDTPPMTEEEVAGLNPDVIIYQ